MCQDPRRSFQRGVSLHQNNGLFQCQSCAVFYMMQTGIYEPRSQTRIKNKSGSHIPYSIAPGGSGGTGFVLATEVGQLHYNVPSGRVPRTVVVGLTVIHTNGFGFAPILVRNARVENTEQVSQIYRDFPWPPFSCRAYFRLQARKSLLFYTSLSINFLRLHVWIHCLFRGTPLAKPVQRRDRYPEFTYRRPS